MRILIATLASLATAFASAPAHAVLDSAIAAKFDSASVYQGCPAIGAGAASPQPSLCKNLQTPETYCATFTASTPLRNDPVVKNGYAACLAFYKAAVDSQQLICDYVKDAANLQGPVQDAAKKIDSAKSADAATAFGARCARKIYGYYREAALAQAGRLDKAYRAGHQPLTKMADEGQANLKAEVHCQKNGAGAAPPGILLVGVTAQAMSDQKATADNLSGTLGRFSILMLTQFNAAGSYLDRISKQQDALGSVPIGGITEGTPKDSVGTAEDSMKKPLLVSGGFAVPAFGLALAGGAEAVEGALAPLIAAKAVQCLAAGYVLHGKIEYTDMVVALGTVGVGVVAAVAGAPATVTLAGAFGIRLVAEKIRADWNAYDNEIARAYKSWFERNVRVTTETTSAQVGQAYASVKQQMAYCSQCGSVDAAANCPGNAGYTHGYNDNYLNTTPGFINPWVKKVWDEKNPGYKLLLRIPPVSPVSTSP